MKLSTFYYDELLNHNMPNPKNSLMGYIDDIRNKKISSTVKRWLRKSYSLEYLNELFETLRECSDEEFEQFKNDLHEKNKKHLKDFVDPRIMKNIKWLK